MNVKHGFGFSLVEVLIAMVLLAGATAMATSAFTSSLKSTQPGANVAYNFGRGIMEKMYEFVRDDQWATLALPLSTTTVPQPGTAGAFTPQNSIKALNGKTYTATYVVNDNTGVPINANSGAGDTREDFRKVKVTINW